MLPNLVELPPRDVQAQIVDGRHLLRFTSTAVNGGRADNGGAPRIELSDPNGPAAPPVATVLA